MRNIIKILFVAALVVAVQACDSVLDTEPSTALTPDQALNSPEAVDALRTNLYSRLHTATLTTNYMLSPSVLADGLTNTSNATRYRGYVTYGTGVNESGVGTWNFSYSTINAANIIINKIPEGVLDEATSAQYRGEALWFRAFALHNLVRAYGYEPGMAPSAGEGAGWQLGVAIRTEGALTTEDTNYKPRVPVDMVYTQIINDLQQSINLLNGNDSGVPYYVTEAAAHALLARVYLYAQNYQGADEQAALALQTTSAELVQPSGVATMFDETAGLNPGAIFVGIIDPATESVGVNDALSSYTSEQWSALVPTPDIVNLYSGNDARLAWFAPCFDEIDGVVPSGCPASHPAISGSDSDGLEIQKWNAEAGQYADDVPYLRVAEMLLIQAEARLKGAGGDPLAPLNQLRAARGLAPYTGTDIMQAILDGRRREFIAEGQRFWDLKRLGMDIPKVASQRVFNNNLTDILYIDYQILDAIPRGEVQLSQQNAPEDSVLIQNPGY